MYCTPCTRSVISGCHYWLLLLAYWVLRDLYHTVVLVYVVWMGDEVKYKMNYAYHIWYSTTVPGSNSIGVLWSVTEHLLEVRVLYDTYTGKSRHGRIELCLIFLNCNGQPPLSFASFGTRFLEYSITLSLKDHHVVIGWDRIRTVSRG